MFKSINAINGLNRVVVRISWLPTALFIIAVPLFIVTACVTWAFNNPGVYKDGFEKYNISYVNGITEADLEQVSADIRGYFNSTQEPLELRTRVFGREQELFKPNEIVHMRDVKRLLWGVYIIGAISAIYLLLYVGVGFLRHGRNYYRALALRIIWSGGFTLALLVAVGMFALVGFETLFLKFHQLSFANDFWKLDPRTDFLVMLFPQDFWFDATMWVALRAVAGVLIILAVASTYLIYLRLWAPAGSGKAISPVE